jgi:hypothetical protein
VLAALDALPDGLVPVERRDTAAGHLFVLRARTGCRRCGWPMDSESKFEAALSCAQCVNGWTRCRRCGRAMADGGSGWELCAVCPGTSERVPCAKCGRPAAVNTKDYFNGLCSLCKPDRCSGYPNRKVS